MADFAGKRIVITGGAGPVGIETARGFMDQGGHVIVVDRDAAALAAVHERLGRLRLGTFLSPLDTPAACAEALESAGAPVAALVHMAGLSGPVDPENWPTGIATALTGAHAMVSAFATRCDRRDTPRVVLVGSLGMDLSEADAAARGAMAGLTRALARKLAPDILVNAVAAGRIALRDEDGEATDIPLRRPARPAEIAAVIRFLCGAGSSYVTAQTIAVDGGLGA